MRTILHALTAHTADAPRHALNALTAQTADGTSGGGVLNMLFMFGLMFVVIYFMLIRPQQKQQKQHKELLSGLKKGDEVVTQGGIYGRIYAVADADVTLEIAKDVRIRILKSQVAGLQKTETAAAEAQAAEKK